MPMSVTDILWVTGGGLATLVVLGALACWIARERPTLFPPQHGFPVGPPDPEPRQPPRPAPAPPPRDRDAT